MRWTWSDDPAVWLSWIQGATTVILTVLTGVYVHLTRTVAKMATMQAEAATAASQAVRQQHSSDLLAIYSPVLSAVSSALGNVRASRLVDLPVDVPVTPPDLQAAVQLSAQLDPALAASMKGALLMLNQTDQQRANLRSYQATVPPDSPVLNYLRESANNYLQSAEAVLAAIYSELSPEVDRLMEVAERKRVTLSSLKLPTPPSSPRPEA